MAGTRPLPYVLFLVSGASSLVVEVMGLELLARIFGSTAAAAATTLASFFLGLGLGAWLGGRWAGRLRRPLAAYGLLEIGVGLGALLLLALVPLEAWLYGAVFAEAPAFVRTVGRVVLAFLVFAPSTIAMGATFPVMAEHVVRQGERLGRGGALLYAVNTLGAATGTALAGFVLPPWIGIRATLLTAVLTSLLVGLVAILAARALRRDDTESIPSGAPPRGPRVLAFASGFGMMALQVLFVRAFSLALPASIQVFALVLVTWLVGLALGGWFASRLARGRGEPRAVLAILVALGALLVAWAPTLLAHRTDGFRPPPPDLAWGPYLRMVAGHAAIVLLPAVTLLGAFLPYLLRWVERYAPGRSAGALVAANTAGSILGALFAAFVVLPVLGLWTGVRVLALGYALTSLVLARPGRSVPAWLTALAAVVVVGASLTFDRPPVVRLNTGERMVALEEGAAGTVAVVEQDGNHKLVYDNVFTLGSSHDARWEAMQAHVPLLLHAAPRRVFFLGLGTGITAGGALDHAVERVEVGELVPEVAAAAREHFGPWTNALFVDERARVVVDDARHRLQHDRRRWDVVIGDLFFPWQPGTAYLFTREHLEAVRGRLDEGGLFAQWLPCYQLGEEELQGILRTFVDVFPQVTLWRGDFFVGRPIVAVIGHRDVTPLDPEAMVSNARGLVFGSGAAIAASAETVPFHLYAGNLTASRALLADAHPLTDDRPWIQWTAPRSERGHRLEDAPMATGDRLLRFEEALAAATPPDQDPALVRLDDQQRKSVRAGLVLRRLAVHLDAFRTVEHRRAMLDYVRLVPSRIRAPLDTWIE